MKRTVGSIVALTLVAVAWFVIAPQKLGGPATYLITSGNSMEPTLHEGDLVILRETGDYGAGDIAAYRSSSVGEIFVHRIVEQDGDSFVFKGDNKEFDDSERPTGEQILGEKWIVIPGGGKVIAWMREPLHAAAITALLVLLFSGVGMTRVRRKRGRREIPRPRPSIPVAARLLVMTAAVVVLAASSLVAFVASRTSPTTTTERLEYMNEGVFEYGASVDRSPVYPSGKVRTGQPMFLNLADQMTIAFEHSLTGVEAVELDGTLSLDALLSDQSGWQRTFVIAGPHSLSEGGKVAGELNLADLRRLVRRVERLTGVDEPFLSLDVVAHVDLNASAGGAAIADDFSAVLPFSLDDLKLTIARDRVEGTADPLLPLQPGEAEVVTSVPARVALGPLSAPAGMARTAALVSGLLALLCLLVAAIWRGKVDATDDVAAISRRYGHMIADVHSTGANIERKAVQMRSIEDLAQLAEHYQRVILHDHHDGIHSYVVEEDGIAYWYQVIDPHDVPSNVHRIGPAPASEDRERAELRVLP